MMSGTAWGVGDVGSRGGTRRRAVQVAGRLSPVGAVTAEGYKAGLKDEINITLFGMLEEVFLASEILVLPYILIGHRS